MRIAVVGLGGVGGYIAANLAQTSHKIVGFARGEHLKKIQKEGLQIIEDTKVWSAALEAKTLEEAEGSFDVVLFCVKSYDLQSSYEQIARHVDSQTILLSLSNGVSNGDVLKKLSGCKVLDACVYILSHVQEAGVVRKKGEVFALVIGPDEEAAHALKRVFDAAGLRVKISNDIKTDIWKKYIFISAFATLTSYYDKSIGYIIEHHRAEAKTLLEEIADVAHAKGVEIFDEVEKSLQTASKVPYDSSTSMRLDFQNKKRVELESLSAYVLKEAQIYGVKTPLMKKMYEKLRS
ncbi:2-dehydropantoate 2-reductase [bacterium]|nr:2-dehydropantoate 2-reductase [bacterium]MBU1993825.1 2-dehydropantoate 2-reductase [bacterium]